MTYILRRQAMEDDPTISISRNDEASRYEAHVDGEFAGVIEFSDEGDAIRLTHTEVFDQFRGTETASTLAGQALADVAESGKSIIPECPYIAHYLKKHRVPGATIQAPEE
jgi:predicted GNAT family acetyltransferase